MSDLKQVWAIENLRLAWQRIRSNPDRAYKGYFRDAYTAYAIAGDAQLNHLQDRLRRGIYGPTDACKIYFPKPSGILRPYSLLCVEDQIVYQAIANVIAEKLAPHVKSKYEKEVFGHLYAGFKSPWFYKKWSEGYRAFNSASEATFNAGYVWTASFDLTAFYDSIDHHVLRQMLSRIGVTNDVIDFLTQCLTKWTATATKIYHNHGIPQGPLSSGLIAEVVLKHFDENHHINYKVTYLRYVDDIRLFAKQEKHLRYALVKLDRLSKDVGLFPQSSKIDIHQVANIQDELKSISNPNEALFLMPSINQSALRKAISEITPGKRGYAVLNPTRFKFLVASATASNQLMDRLWRVFEHAPHYYPQIASHLSKFKVLSNKQADRLLLEIEAQELYPAVRAALINSAIGRIPSPYLARFKTIFKKLWQPKFHQPDLSNALWSWLQDQSGFTLAQQKYGLTKVKPDWLAASMHYRTRWLDIDEVSRTGLINTSLRSKSADVALAAAWIAAFLEVSVKGPSKGLNPQAVILLKELGVLKRAGSFVCGIRKSIFEMTSADIPIDWRSIFGSNYKKAEAQIVSSKGYFQTSATAWVNSMDGFNDWLLDSLYRADPFLGSYKMGEVGSVMNSKKMGIKYPALYRYLNEIHDRRYLSHLSHAVVRANQKPTRAIKFEWLKTGSRLLRNAMAELHGSGY